MQPDQQWSDRLQVPSFRLPFMGGQPLVLQCLMRFKHFFAYSGLQENDFGYSPYELGTLLTVFNNGTLGISQPCQMNTFGACGDQESVQVTSAGGGHPKLDHQDMFCCQVVLKSAVVAQLCVSMFSSQAMQTKDQNHPYPG